MGVNRNTTGATKKDTVGGVKDLLNNILNFGPHHEPLSSATSDRLKRLVKQLEDINARIEKLSTKI
jgi:hypothetical protein